MNFPQIMKKKNTNIEPEIPESLVTKENTTTETIPEKEGESTDTPNKSSSHENATIFISTVAFSYW